MRTAITPIQMLTSSEPFLFQLKPDGITGVSVTSPAVKEELASPQPPPPPSPLRPEHISEMLPLPQASLHHNHNLPTSVAQPQPSQSDINLTGSHIAGA